MKTKFNGILTLFLAFVVQITFAQERIISGTVSDESGPLPGVSVLKKGTAQGTETDFDGKYSIKAKTGDVLVYSFVGLETSEKTVGSSNNINVSMQSGNVLDEIVVTALGVKKQKKSLGYAQQTIKADDILTSKQTDISNAIAGKISGIQFVGAPSSGFNASKLKLRGDVNVLYVVDGIRLTNPEDINPEDVETMSVLKGAAATALYGPEGANGVVIIASKKGSNGKTQFMYDGSIELGNSDYLPELQTEYGGGYSQNFSTFSYNPSKDPASWAAFDGQPVVYYAADESWGPKLDGRLVRQWDSWIPGNPNFGKMTPWKYNGGIGEFFETAITTKHNISISKGGEDYSLKLGFLRNDRTLALPNTKRATNRISLSASMNVTSKLKFSSNVFFGDVETLNNPLEGYGSLGANFFQWWQNQLDVKKLRDYRQNGQVVSWNIKGPRDASPKYWDSPYFELYENIKNGNRKSINGNFDLDYQINDNLAANLSLKKTYGNTKYNARVAFDGLNQPSYAESSDIVDRNLFTGNLSYTKDFNKLSFTGLGGFELSDYKREVISASTKGGLNVPGFYNIDTSKERPNYSNYTAFRKNRAAYITTSFGYNDWAFLEASLRKDWSSTAAIDDNGVLTKGISLSLIVTDLLPKNDILTYMKIRGGLSEAPKFPSVYRLSPTFSTPKAFDGLVGASQPVSSIKSSLFNTELRGGTRNEYEVGTELQFFKNRLSLDFTYFNKVDDELPVAVSLDPTSGYSSVFKNEGKQTYKGFEVGLRATPVRNDNFRWETSLNFATLERFVNKVSNSTTSTDRRFLSSRWGGLLIRNEEGKEWGAVYGRKVKEINGKKVLSSSANYVTEDDQYLGNFLPDFTGGFINNFKYKNFTLGIDTDFQIGGKFFSITRMFNNYSGLGIATVGNNDLGNPVRNPITVKDGSASGNPYVKVSDAGSNSGGTKVSGVDENGNDVSYYIDTQRFWGNQFGNISEFSYDASYLSIRNIRLGYTFNEDLVKRFGLDELSFFTYVNNAFLLFSELPNVDPSQLEQVYGNEGDGTVNFMEGGQLPGLRTYGFNIRLKF